MSNDKGKPRLLVLTSTFPRWMGDHEPPFVFELARRLTTRFDVTVLAPHAPGARVDEMMDGVKVHRFRYAPAPLEQLAYDGGIPVKLRRKRLLVGLVPVFLVAQAIAAFRLSYQLRPQAVHAHWLIPQGALGVLIARLTRPAPRLLVTAHGADVFGFGSALASWLKRRVIQSADILTVPSKAVADQVLELHGHTHRLEILPMGTDLHNRFVPNTIADPVYTLVFSGRLVPKKGVDTLLQALQLVIARYPECRLLVLGDGPERDTLQRLTRHLGIAENVHFYGPFKNSELPTLLQQARIATLPFRHSPGGDQEGLGLATIECMGCGLPVIIGDVPATRDVVNDGVTGLVVPSDNPERLAAGIQRLLADPVLAKRLAAAGREFVVDRFDWQNIASRYARLLGSKS